MSRFLKFVLSGSMLASSALVFSPVASVQALSFDSGKNFPVCGSDAAAEFCIEKFEFTTTGGVTRSVTPAIESMGNLPEVNVTASFFQNYTGPTGTPDSSGFLPALGLNFYDTGSNAVGGASTAEGLRDGTYRVVLRTGDYDPSLMTLTGQFNSYSVVQGADGNFTIDISAKPKSLARVVQMGSDDSVVKTCEANNWVTSCAANQASRLYIDASFSMFYDSQFRSAMRGAWISTNASTTQISTADLLTGQVNVIAKGPHTVPTDFGVTGAGEENGKQLNPAFFEEYLPFSLISKMMSQVNSADITTEMVKSFFTNTTDLTSALSGSISVSTSGQAPVATAQSLGITTDASGVRVNFNLTHFSAPNPSLKITTPVVLIPANILSIKAKATTSAAAVATFAKLVVAPKSTVSLKVANASKTICTVLSTKVKGVTTMKLKGLKKGTCNVTVIVTPKKGAATRAVVPVSIT